MVSTSPRPDLFLALLGQGLPNYANKLLTSLPVKGQLQQITRLALTGLAFGFQGGQHHPREAVRGFDSLRPAVRPEVAEKVHRHRRQRQRTADAAAAGRCLSSWLRLYYAKLEL